jgi:hypothetical protein
MPRQNLPYVKSYKDRTGKMRYYLRRPGCKDIALSGAPGSREFAQSYASATTAPKLPKKARLTPPKEGSVYYLRHGERIKIGFTIDWGRRQKAYRTHNSEDLELLAIRPGFRRDETHAHREFKQYRIGDTEWFHPGPELLEHIDRLNGV